jgi:hypothetical protein
MRAEWTEQPLGGSYEAERAEFEQLARDIMRVQLKNQRAAARRGATTAIDRAFHAKSTLAVAGAQLRFLDLPHELQVEFAKPGAVYPTAVRFSNGMGIRQPDFAPDVRGVALRIDVSERCKHDLLLSNWPASHARNARQFVKFAVAMSGGKLAKVVGPVRLTLRFGPLETARMLLNLYLRRRQKVRSIASQTYWSQGAIRWGDTLAVRYLLCPLTDGDRGPKPSAEDPDYLSAEIARRLARDDARFLLCIQRFKSEKKTPIEDSARRWSRRAAPPVPVAMLTIGKRDLGTADAQAAARAVDELAFNPWNTTELFRPLGNLHRARKAAYDASAAHRHALRWQSDPPRRNLILGAVARRLFAVLNRWVEWHRLPAWLSLMNLAGFRDVLRRRNLIDTEVREARPSAREVPRPPEEQIRIWRTHDGTFNDLSEPCMGAAKSTFGRNLKPDHRPELFDEPNPITVSRELLRRDVFLRARSLNLLAAAWIQFQVHDWASHKRYPLGERDVVVPLPPEMDEWWNTPKGPPERVMRIVGNRPARRDPHDGLGPRFGNQVSHWWDGSEVYGSDRETALRLRDGAKLRLEGDFLPRGANGAAITGFTEGWWLGLSGMHTLFAREHNLLCDELSREYPDWDQERVYQTARLIVSALIAKIHTIEWTPAILATKALDIGMRSNWNGPPANDWLTRLGIWLLDSHASVGIPSTRPDHHGAPFSLTEDFVSVYRMHPLLPDDYLLYDQATGEPLGEPRRFSEIQGEKGDKVLRDVGLGNLLYSFGIANPGAIRLHNYPKELMRLESDGACIDLSVVDLVRDRRRGVPRYNDFRAGLHKPRIKRWEELCPDDPESAACMQDLYGSIDRVDTMVGLFAERPPDGFGFSDTAFRIFILMASRRLQSDRFLTVDFRPELYSPLGMDWVARNGMHSVILRHCPELAPVLPRDTSAFAPWRTVAAT